MTIRVEEMAGDEFARLAPPDEQSGLGALATERGNLPLDEIDLTARITGLTAETQLSQGFHNPYEVPLEATYVFPLPDRAAVTAMRMETADGVVEGVLRERQRAREEYQTAIESGRRASIAEEERPDVFTMRVGNILPGERVTVRLTLAGVVPYEDGAATYRFPLVVAPRYIPGTPIEEPVGSGVAADTDAVPDASRITPPVLLPGFPNPVRLTIAVDLDPAGLPLRDVRSSLHTVEVTEAGGVARITVAPGERVNRDFVLRWGLGGGTDSDTDRQLVADSLVLVPDADRDTGGTFQLTLLPPELPATTRPRDVVLVLDRSGSMGGWKMVTARRAAARIVDTLGTRDRFGVLAFDFDIDRPPSLGHGLVEATDRNRFRAVEFLAGVDSRGGTEMLEPLRTALRMLSDADDRQDRDQVLVLVTDGQVGNEDQILHDLGGDLKQVRVHTVGIDTAVNAGFLGRLASLGGGRCELVESEDRLDDAMDQIHRRIATPLVTGLHVVHEDLGIEPDSMSPHRLPDVFPGAPVRLTGRYSGGHSGSIVVAGTTATGEQWYAEITATTSDNAALPAVWARARLRDLEDRYLMERGHGSREALERSIVDTSLRYGVLCRFTAYLAVDSRVVNEGGQLHQVTQPVEPPADWMGPVVPASHGGPAPAAPQVAGPAQPGAAMRRAMTSFAPVPAPAGGAAGGSGADVAYQVVTEAGDERQRLAAVADGTALERWQALADLANRLRGTARFLEQAGVAVSERQPLVRLAEELSVCDGPLPDDFGELERLWRRAVEVLDALVAGAPDVAGAPSATSDTSADTGRGSGGATGGRKRGIAFWKR